MICGGIPLGRIIRLYGDYDTMARKISEEAAIAFFNDRPFKKSNTQIFVARTGYSVTTVMELHGTKIAWRKDGGAIFIDTHGWGTSQVTKDRINTLIHSCSEGASLYSVKGTPTIGGFPYYSGPIRVNCNFQPVVLQL